MKRPFGALISFLFLLVSPLSALTFHPYDAIDGEFSRLVSDGHLLFQRSSDLISWKNGPGPLDDMNGIVSAKASAEKISGNAYIAFHTNDGTLNCAFLGRDKVLSTPVRLGTVNASLPSYDISAAQRSLSVAWISPGDTLFISTSFDGGLTWSAPQTAAEQARGPVSIAAHDDRLAVTYFKMSSGTYDLYSASQILPGGPADTFKVGTYIDPVNVSSTIDPFGLAVICAVGNGRLDIFYTKGTSAPKKQLLEDVSINASDDLKLLATSNGIICLLFDKVSGQTKQIKLQGMTALGLIRSIRIVSDNFVPGDSNGSIGTVSGSPFFIDIETESPFTFGPFPVMEIIENGHPIMSSPAEKISSNTYRSGFPGFPKGTEKVLSIGLTDGTSALRDIPYWSFKADTTPPEIRGLLPEDMSATASEEAIISGSVEPGALITAGTLQAVPDSSGYFQVRVPLKEGLNTIDITASDRSSNLSSRTVTILKDTYAPKLTFTRPAPETWGRPGSAIAVEVLVEKGRAEIEDETEAVLKVNGSVTDSDCIFSQQGSVISGFALLPKDISSGRARLTVEITDKGGNTGSASSDIDIDCVPPYVAVKAPGSTVFSNNTEGIELFISDDGAGPDLFNSVITTYIDGSTLEGVTYVEPGSGRVLFKPLRPLSASEYIVSAILRDLAGNTSEEKRFRYVLDMLPPELHLDRALPKETKERMLLLSGRVLDLNAASVSVLSDKKQQSSQATDGKFMFKVPLEKGPNRISMIARDLAGNITSHDTEIIYHAPPEQLVFEFAGKRVKSGDFVDRDATLKILDPVSGTGLSGATVLLDGTSVPYKPLDGTAAIAMMRAGTHTLKVDYSGTEYTLIFTVGSGLAVKDLLACPSPLDPAKGPASITFNSSAACDCSLRIFSITGEMVYSASGSAATGFNSGMTWSGRMADGNYAPNGTYIIVLECTDIRGQKTAARTKAVVLR